MTEFVTITHPDIEGRPQVPRESFEPFYEGKGWTIVKEDTTDPLGRPEDTTDPLGRPEDTGDAGTKTKERTAKNRPVDQTPTEG